MESTGDGVSEKAYPSLWSRATSLDNEWSKVIDAAVFPRMRRHQSEVGEWRHLLLKRGAMFSSTRDAFAKGATHGGAILEDPHGLS